MRDFDLPIGRRSIADREEFTSTSVVRPIFGGAGNGVFFPPPFGTFTDLDITRSA